MLAFEIHVTNFQDEAFDLRSLWIADGGGRTMATYRGEELTRRLRLLGRRAGDDATRLQAGAAAVFYVELYFASDSAPNALGVELDCSDAAGRSLTVGSRAGIVSAAPVPVLAAPLRGGKWVAVHDPSWERGHRRVVYTLDGKARIPGRYAVDWVGVDDDGRTSNGDPDKPADAIGYGAAVLAGADAEVAEVRDGMVEAPSIAGNPHHLLGQGSGNYVALRLADGRFAFYEHLRPGSIRVRAGDRVKSGR